MWSKQSKEVIGGSFSAAQYDNAHQEGGRAGGRKGKKKGGRKTLKNIREFFMKRPKIKEGEGGREGGGGGGGGGGGYGQGDMDSYASFDDEDVVEGEGGSSSSSSSSSDDSSSDYDSSEDEGEDEDELEENLPPGMAANVSSKPRRMPSVAAEKWTFRATVRCERTGKWALLWESDAATTYYTEQPNENWQAYLPPGSLSKCLPSLPPSSAPLHCHPPGHAKNSFSLHSPTPSLPLSLPPSLPPSSLGVLFNLHSLHSTRALHAQLPTHPPLPPFLPPSLGVLSNWHSLHTTHASMLNVEAGATFYVQPLGEDEREGGKEEREKEWVFATVEKEECEDYAVSFVGLSFKAPDVFFLGQFVRSLLD